MYSITLDYLILEYKQQLLLMSGHIKNFQLIYENKQTIIPPRVRKIEGNKGLLRELNVLKIFTRMAKTNSFAQKESNETKSSEQKKEEERFIVVSKFTNATVPMELLTKNFKLHRQRIKTNASDLLCQNQASEKTINFSRIKTQSKSVKSTQKMEKFSLPCQKDQKSQMLIGKKNLTSNYSQNKSKYYINNQLQKSVIQPQKSLKSKSTQKIQRNHPLLAKDTLQLKDIKSQSFIVVDLISERTVVSHRSTFAVEIASLTKIMTFYTVMQIAAQKGIDVKSAMIKVSSFVGHIVGTVAQLVEGDEYTVEQLLYGLMLPSGNDAANELANWGGLLLLADKEKGYRLCRAAFIDEMNKQARNLNLKNTLFGNPHGLPHQGAKSTAADLAKLCCKCMKNLLFRKIVSCKSYKLAVKSGKGTRLIQWQNTNKLLRRQGFIGLKTGITVTAGPCLAAAYNFRDRTYISIILRAPKVSSRFKQTRHLLYWTLSKLHRGLNELQLIQLRGLKEQNHDLDSDYSEDEQEFIYGNKSQDEHRRRCNILDYEL